MVKKSNTLDVTGRRKRNLFITHADALNDEGIITIIKLSE